MVDKCDLTRDCTDPSCVEIAASWREWADNNFGKHDPAMITLADDYQKTIGGKGRNMLRKVIRNDYYFDEFEFNNYLNDIYEINVSMPIRGGMHMTDSYTEPVTAIMSRAKCWHHGQIYVGGFLGDRLMAYSYLYVCGDLAIVNRILGHKDALPDGVMNGLVDELVTQAASHECRYINYLTMESRTEGLARFKKGVGFRSTKVEFA